MHRSLETSLQQDPNIVCKKTQSFFQRTADFCKSKPNLVSTFLAGMKTSVDECQWQFRNRRWNCTTSRNSIKGILRYGKLSTKTNKHRFNLCTLLSMDFRAMSHSQYHKILNHVHDTGSLDCGKEKLPNQTSTHRAFFVVVDCSDYRETAFIYAITSAGATFSVTRACRMGQLSNCGCRKPERKVAVSSQVLTNNLIATQPRNDYPARDNMNNLPNQVFPGENNEFEWGGCSDNIHYGYTISKQLMAKNRGKDGRSMVIEHNNEAGRLVSSAFLRCTKYCFDFPKPFPLVWISTRRSGHLSLSRYYI